MRVAKSSSATAPARWTSTREPLIAAGPGRLGGGAEGRGGSGQFVLNGILNQRSQDILAANNWNVVQYAVLIYMLAQVNGMLPGQLVHVISDAHIYDRHVDIIREMIERPQYPAPKFALNPEIKNFYDFTLDDITITDYKKNPQIKNIPIAV